MTKEVGRAKWILIKGPAPVNYEASPMKLRFWSFTRLERKLTLTPQLNLALADTVERVFLGWDHPGAPLVFEV